MTEEERYGGYVVFDMTFVEFGKPASVPTAATVPVLTQSANDLLSSVTGNIAAGPQPAP
jgi:hypothetical protein